MSHRVFYKNALWQYGLQVVKYLFPLITLPYLTRVLAPEGYAVYAYVLAFMSFVQIFVDFGFNLSGTRQIAAARSVREMNEVIGGITQARIVLCVVAGIAVALVSQLIPIMRENFLYGMLAYVAVCGRAVAPDFIFQGKERMAPLTTRYFASKGVSTLLTFLVVRSFADILWVPALDILASAIALTWSFAAARRVFGARPVKVPLRRAVSELKDSGLYCVSNMSSAVFTGFTTLLIGIVVADQSLIAFWSLAMTAVSAVQALYSPIVNSLYPRMIASGDFAFARKLALVAFPVVIIGTVAFALLAPQIVLILGGKSYAEGAWVVSAVSPVLAFSFFGMLFGWPVLGALGKVQELTFTTIISALVSILLLLGLSLTGQASLAAVAVVRSGIEALMCALRVAACLKARREGCFTTTRTSRDSQNGTS